MSKIVPCLWFNGNAEEAARFYTSLLPDSRIDSVNRSPTDYPSGRAGDVLTVEFTLNGQRFLGLNGGPAFPFTQAVSFTIECDDQAEVDRLWDALTTNGGAPVQCGWARDRYGLSWQITPKMLPELLKDADREKAERAMRAMMGMVKIDIDAVRKAAAGADAT
jgi:predicted 3-demethylubiquinone-9 3-methyltransferase (glyoxalase superfamily)